MSVVKTSINKCREHCVKGEPKEKWTIRADEEFHNIQHTGKQTSGNGSNLEIAAIKMVKHVTIIITEKKLMLWLQLFRQKQLKAIILFRPTIKLKHRT